MNRQLRHVQCQLGVQFVKVHGRSVLQTPPRIATGHETRESECAKIRCQSSLNFPRFGSTSSVTSGRRQLAVAFSEASPNKRYSVKSFVSRVHTSSTRCRFRTTAARAASGLKLLNFLLRLRFCGHLFYRLNVPRRAG